MLDRVLHGNLPPRSEAQAEADIARDRDERRFRCLDPADKLDELIVAAKGLKLKLLAANKWPADPATRRQWQIEHCSYPGCFDLTDEIGSADELIEELEFQRELMRRGR